MRPLKDLLVSTKDGEWGTEEPAKGLVPMRVIRGTDFESVSQGNLRRAPIRYIPEATAIRKTLHPWDILIETAGGSKGRPTGRTMLVKPSLLRESDMLVTCASFARYLRVDPQAAKPQFIYWFLQSLYQSGQMEAHQVQHTGVARFQYSRFASTVAVPLPAPPQQNAIAAILGSLDDKIELNRKMNETLEQMAQAIFKSWFIDFDGHTEFQDSPLGPIPKGWTASTLLDAVEMKRGYDLPKDARVHGTIPVCSSSGISGYHNEAKAGAPGVVTGRYGTIGQVFYLDSDFWPLNTSLYARDFKGNQPRFIHHLLSRVDFTKYTDKAAVPGVNRNHLHQEQIVLPPIQRQEEFTVAVAPLNTRARHNERENKTLGELRDTLLPKLISGEVRIKDADKMVGEAT